MKVSIAVSILILVIGAVIGRHDRQQLAALRTTQQRLAAKAGKLGVSSDPANLTKRERPVRAPAVKLSTDEIIALARELEQIGPFPSSYSSAYNALQFRILESLSALDPAGLIAVLTKIYEAQDLNPAIRANLGYSCIAVLAHDHPQAALGIFTSSPELFREDDQIHLVCTALATWTKGDLTAAIDWLKKNPQPFSDNAKLGIISTVAEQDPQHAFRLIGLLDLQDKNQVAWQIMNSAKTFDQKSATLAGLREYLPTIQDGDSLDHYGESYLSMLAHDMHREDIEAITGWISASKLTPQELDPFLDGLVNATNSETGRWIEWMRQSLPAEQADRRVENLIRQWATRDYQAAARWAASKPEGKDHQQVLETIHRYWPQQDPAGREAFARKHGIE